jgi:hypothetical protein
VRIAGRRNGNGGNQPMVALTITIGAVVLVVLVVAGVRALRRASRKIDDILREELDRPDED